jgi:hypothetical protein
MIGAGERMGNTTPPSIAVPAFAAAQAGLLLAAEPPCGPAAPVAARGPPQPGRHNGLIRFLGPRAHLKRVPDRVRTGHGVGDGGVHQRQRRGVGRNPVLPFSFRTDGTSPA